MLKNIVFKKEYLLIVAGIVLLIAAYRLAFRKTIEQWHLHTQLEAKLAGAGNASYQPGYFSRKNANLNKIIRLYKVDTTLFRNNSVNAVSLIAQRNGAKLVNIPLQELGQDTSKIVIEKLELAGDYFSLLKTVAALNATNDIGRLRSLSFFEVTKVASVDAKSTHMEIYLEIMK